MKQRLSCGYASRYKTIRAPTCGCVACQRKWDESRANPERAAMADMIMDAHAKGEPVRTSFDRVFPGMPPALKLSA